MIIDVGRIASTVASSAGRAAEVVRHTAMTMAKTLSDPKVGVPVAITAVKGLTFISDVMPDVMAMLNKMADDMANFDPASILGEFNWISFPRVELKECNALDVVCHFENGLRNLYNGFAVIGEGLANALYFIGYHFVYYLIKGLALLSSAVVRYVVMPVTNMVITVGGLIKDALISFFCAYLRVAVPLLTSYKVVRGVLNGKFDMWSVVVGILGTVAAYSFVPECGIIQMPETVTINTSSKFDRLYRDSIHVSDSFTFSTPSIYSVVFDDYATVQDSLFSRNNIPFMFSDFVYVGDVLLDRTPIYTILNDVVSVVDVLYRQKGVTSEFEDFVKVVDEYSRSEFVTARIGDFVKVTDELIVYTRKTITFDDFVSIDNAMPIVKSTTYMFTDVINAGDSLMTQFIPITFSVTPTVRVSRREFNDTISVINSSQNVKVVFSAFSDVVDVVDSLYKEVYYEVMFNDVVELSDSIQQVIRMSRREFSDTISVVDSLQDIRTVYSTFNDVINVVDNTSQYIYRIVTLNDVVTVRDSTPRVNYFNVSLYSDIQVPGYLMYFTDRINVTDSANVSSRSSGIVNVNDSITVIDSFEYRTSSRITSANDYITVVDRFEYRTAGRTITVNDSITVVDSFTRTSSKIRRFDDSVTVRDSSSSSKR